MRAMVCWVAVAGLLAGGTAWAQDRIEVDGGLRVLLSDPLQPWLAMHPEAAQMLDAGPCRRAGVAEWVLDADGLWLQRIGPGPARASRPADDGTLLVRLFGQSAPVPASWVDGMLVIGEGEGVRDGRQGYAGGFVRYRVLTLRGGRLVRQARLSWQEFEQVRDARMAGFRPGARYRQALAEDAARWPQDDPATRAVRVDQACTGEALLLPEDTSPP